MTILAALAKLYERLTAEGKAPPRGYSMEKIGGEVVIDENGQVQAIRDLRVPDEKGRLHPRIMAVPAQAASNPTPCGTKPLMPWA